MTQTLIRIGGVDYQADALNLPATRVDRDSWVVGNDGVTVGVDITKAEQLKQEEADAKEAEIFEGTGIIKALADATVDLVLAAKNGQLNDLNRNQIRQQLRQRVRVYARQNVGLNSDPSNNGNNL